MTTPSSVVPAPAGHAVKFTMRRAGRGRSAPNAATGRGGAIARATIALAILVFATPAAAQPPAWRLDPIGGWGGPVNHVQVEGDIAYVGSGQRLVVLDVSDEANPIEIGSIGLVKAVQDFVVRDGYAFVATWDTPYRFCVVDVSDPTDMRVVWSATRSEVGRAMEVDLFGDIAYVRGGPRGVDLEAFDITNPESPVHMGRALSSSGGFKIEEAQIVGSLLYVAGDTDPSGSSRAYLAIYDLSGDPAKPLLLASLSDPFPINSRLIHVAVEEPYAYLIVDESIIGDDDRSYLWVADVSDPENPASVGQVVVTLHDEFGFVANDLAVRDQIVYLADWTGGSPTPQAWNFARGLVVFDATDPTDPRFVRNVKPHGTVRGVRAADDRLYVLDDGEGLFIADITDRLNPDFIGNYYSPALLRAMVKDDELLYVCDAYNGFTILDVSDPNTIAVRGVYQTRNAGLGLDMQDIRLDGDRAYLNVGYDGFSIVDVSDPSNPVFLGAHRLQQEDDRIALGMAVSPSLVPGEVVVFIGFEPFTGAPTFRSYNVTDPQAIEEIDRLILFPTSTKVELSESQTDGHTVAFIATGGLPHIVNLSDIENMTIDASDGPEFSADMDEQDGYWYIASGASDPDIGGLRVWNAIDTTDPFEVASVRGVSKAISVQGDRAYVSDAQPTATLDVFDVRDPAAPELLLSTRRGTVGTFTRLLADEPFVFGTSSDSTGLATRGDIGLVAFVSSCPADFTGSGDPNDPGYGVPDGAVDAEDFFYFLDQFAAGNVGVADLTGSSDPDDDEYGIPDGEIDVDDFFYFLDLFVIGCP